MESWVRNPEILNPFVILDGLKAEESGSGRKEFPILHWFQKSTPVRFSIIMSAVQG